MKNLLTLWALLICLAVPSPHVHAQYAIVAVPPPPTFTFYDLWHFTATRNDADTYTQFYVSLRVMGENGQLKVKSNSSVFVLPVGTGYYNSSNLTELQPFTSSYHDGGLLQQVITTGGTFQPGSFVFSYTLMGKSADGQFTPLAEDAVQATVEALWPPMLLSPPDGDTIHTVYPLLSWTPAFTSLFAGPITYNLRMTELFPGQMPAQAVVSNPSFFTQSAIPVTILPYPPAAQPLDTGKTYVWQVDADAGGTSLGSSEIWTFRLARNAHQEEEVREKPLIELSTEGSSYFVEVHDGLLRLAFDERLKDIDGNLAFSIYDREGQQVADQTQFPRPVEEGRNKILISLCNGSQGFNLPKGYYRIEVVSQRGDVYRLNFYNNKNLTCADQ